MKKTKVKTIKFLALFLIVAVIIQLSITSCSNQNNNTITNANKLQIIREVMKANNNTDIIVSEIQTTRTKISFNNKNSSLTKEMSLMSSMFNSSKTTTAYLNIPDKEFDINMKSLVYMMNSKKMIILKNSTEYIGGSFMNTTKWAKIKLNENSVNNQLKTINKYNDLGTFLESIPLGKVNLYENHTDYIINLKLSQNEILNLLETNAAQNSQAMNSLNNSIQQIQQLYEKSNKSEQIINLTVEFIINKKNNKLRFEKTITTVNLGALSSLMKNQSKNPSYNSNSEQKTIDEMIKSGIKISTIKTIKYYDYNIKKNINIPAAALNATELDLKNK